MREGTRSRPLRWRKFDEAYIQEVKGEKQKSNSCACVCFEYNLLLYYSFRGVYYGPPIIKNNLLYDFALQVLKIRFAKHKRKEPICLLLMLAVPYWANKTELYKSVL